MRPLPLLTACLLLLSALPAAAQKDKDKDKDEKTFSGKTIAEWVKDLSSDDVTDRRAAALALHRRGRRPYPAVKPLTKALEDRDNAVKFYCLQALGNVGTSPGRRCRPSSRYSAAAT